MSVQASSFKLDLPKADRALSDKLRTSRTIISKTRVIVAKSAWGSKSPSIALTVAYWVAHHPWKEQDGLSVRRSMTTAARSSSTSLAITSSRSTVYLRWSRRAHTATCYVSRWRTETQAQTWAFNRKFTLLHASNNRSSARTKRSSISNQPIIWSSYRSPPMLRK